MNAVNFRRVRITLVTLTLAFVLIAPHMLYPCGPYFYGPVFISKSRPDDPEGYAAGKLGVPLRTYRSVYAFIAYRYLSGQPLSATEQKLVLVPPPGVSVWWGVETDESEKPWFEARATVPEVPPSPTFKIYKDIGNYQSIVNCTPDAFKTAARTLVDRVAKYGNRSADVKEWVAGQDRVFAQCSAGNPATFARPATPMAPLPTMADPSAPEWLKKDRAYQIAAANFYAGNFDEAHTLFLNIANDAGSPWQAWGQYLAGRSLIRKAMLKPEKPDQPFDPKVLAAAETELQQVLANPKLQQVHEAARQVLGFVEFRLHPEEREAQLAKVLAKPGDEQGFQQDLKDYLLLADKTNEPASDMSRWMMAFQYGADADPDEKEAAPGASISPLAEWRKNKTLPWLGLALSEAKSSDAEREKLTAAAEKVQPESPAYPMVIYERARLAPDAQGRKIIEEFLAKEGNKVSLSTKNLFLRERLDRSASFNDFLTYAERRPAATGAEGFGDVFMDYCRASEKNEGCRRAYFDFEAAKIMDLMPVSNWLRAATNTSFEMTLRKRLALTTWCRAVLTENWPVAKEGATLLKQLMPETAKYLDPFLNARTDPERRFAAVFGMLHWPGILPTLGDETIRDAPVNKLDNFRMNWWCTFDRSESGAHAPSKPTPGELRTEQLARSLLTATEGKEAAKEIRIIAGAETAPDYLEPEVLAWAKSHADDPRVPEALHLAITVGHLSCSTSKSGVYSKEAFMLLHQRYPKSEWSRKTKYWYN